MRNLLVSWKYIEASVTTKATSRTPNKIWQLLHFTSKKRARSLNENNPWKQKHSVLKGSFKNVQSLIVSQYLDLKNNSNKVLIGRLHWMSTVYNQIDRQNVFLVT